MNEATICAGLEADYKLQIGGVVVIKHSDRSTVGIPDLSLTWRYRTTWVEVKYLREGEFNEFPDFRPAKYLASNMPQVMLVGKLSHMGSGAYFLIFTDDYIIFLNGWHAVNMVKNDETIHLPRYDNAYNALKMGHKFFYSKRTRSVPAAIAIFFHGGRLPNGDTDTSSSADLQDVQLSDAVPQEERPEF